MKGYSLDKDRKYWMEFKENQNSLYTTWKWVFNNYSNNKAIVQHGLMKYWHTKFMDDSECKDKL